MSFILSGSTQGVNTILLTSLIRSHNDLAINRFYETNNSISFPFSVDADMWDEENPVKIVIRACIIETKYTKEQKQCLLHFFNTLNYTYCFNGERVNDDEVIDCMNELDDIEHDTIDNYMLCM